MYSGSRNLPYEYLHLCECRIRAGFLISLGKNIKTIHNIDRKLVKEIINIHITEHCEVQGPLPRPLPTPRTPHPYLLFVKLTKIFLICFFHLSICMTEFVLYNIYGEKKKSLQALLSKGKLLPQLSFQDLQMESST